MTTSNHTPDTPPSPSTKRLLIILGALATFGPFGTDVYLSAFPNMAQTLHTDIGNIQLTLSVYFMGLAFGQLIYGPLTDCFGRIKPLLFGLTLFAISSFLLAFAPNIESFIAIRLLQALGGCSGIIVGRAIVNDVFDLRSSANFYSTLAVVQGLGPVIAPVMGSLMILIWPWQSVFVMVGVFGLLCLSMSAFGLTETLPADERHSISPRRIAGDYRDLLSSRNFLVLTLARSLTGASIFAYIAGASFVFINLYGVSEVAFGIIFASNAAGTALSAQLNRVLLRRYSIKSIMVGGIVFELAANGVLLALSGGAPIWAYMIPLWLSIATIPVIFANSTALAMNESHGRAGVASAILGTSQFALASVASGMTGFFANGTAYPMAIVMCAMVLAGLLILLVGGYQSPEEAARGDRLPDGIERAKA